MMWTGCMCYSRRQTPWLSNCHPSILGKCGWIKDQDWHQCVCACLAKFSVHQQDLASGLNVPSAIHSRCNLWPKAPICADPLTWPANWQFLESPTVQGGWGDASMVEEQWACQKPQYEAWETQLQKVDKRANSLILLFKTSMLILLWSYADLPYLQQQQNHLNGEVSTNY